MFKVRNPVFSYWILNHKIRKRGYLKNKDKLGDFVDATANIFNYVIDNNVVTNADGILKLTDLMYYMNQVVDKESMFFGVLTAINKYKD